MTSSQLSGVWTADSYAGPDGREYVVTSEKGRNEDRYYLVYVGGMQIPDLGGFDKRAVRRMVEQCAAGTPAHLTDGSRRSR